MSSLRTALRPPALLVGFAILVAGAVLIGGFLSDAAFGLSNPGWEGTTGIERVATEHRTETVLSTETQVYDRTNASGTVAFVLSPDSRYTANQTARIEAFLRRGGTLVLAEDVGTHANPMLNALPVEGRFTGSLLRDERTYYRAPTLPRARWTANGSEQLSEPLVLNNATAIDPGGGRVLARTSPTAYLDRNADGRLNLDEPLRSYPVVVTQSVGEGEVVLVSDPSIFINSMLTRPGNRQFLVSLVTGHSTVVVDESHTGRVPPLRGAVHTFRRSPLRQTALGLSGIVVLWWLGRQRRSLPWDLVQTLE